MIINLILDQAKPDIIKKTSKYTFLFSKKYIYNLIYLISFIGLVCYKWGTLYVHKLYYNKNEHIFSIYSNCLEDWANVKYVPVTCTFTFEYTLRANPSPNNDPTKNIIICYISHIAPKDLYWHIIEVLWLFLGNLPLLLNYIPDNLPKKGV